MQKSKVLKKTKNTAEPGVDPKVPKTPSTFGILGKDLSTKFSSRGERSWRPTKRGGRNGQGKP